jgi:hypothetical protein
MYGSMPSLYLPDGSWAGQFIDEKTARDWAKSKGYDLSKCEISTRKVERKSPHYFTAEEAEEIINSGEITEE